jgi:hypothetical protein
MRNGEAMERSEVADPVLTALRRRFLLDMAWPALSTAICDMFGLPPASEDVAVEEAAESHERMDRMARDPRFAPLLGAAADMSDLLDNFEVEDWQVWLVTYAMATVNMLEDLGLIEVRA